MKPAVWAGETRPVGHCSLGRRLSHKAVSEKLVGARGSARQSSRARRRRNGRSAPDGRDAGFRTPPLDPIQRARRRFVRQPRRKPLVREPATALHGGCCTKPRRAGSVLRPGSENGQVGRHAPTAARHAGQLSISSTHFRERAAPFPKRLYATATMESRSVRARLLGLGAGAARAQKRQRAFSQARGLGRR
jgi:hypothetical protein